MVATEAMIALISPYRVEADGDLTPQTFSLLSTVAKARLDLDNPGLDSSSYDYCHALMILHLYEVKKGGAYIKSEKIGDYSYSKEVSQDTYFQEYQAILLRNAKATISVASSGVERVDGSTSSFDLDEGEIPGFTEEGDT